jgi:hypothetical protein
MAEQTINTIIVLRNDSTTEWQKSSYKLRSGEVGVGYMTRTVDGEDKVVPIIKVGDGTSTWSQLPQAEGVFEQPVTLTQNFGYYNDVPAGSYKTYSSTAGMTTSEFLLSALKKTVEPTITQPNASFSSVSATVQNNDPEMGAYITALNWDGSTSNGKYRVGSAADQATGISASNFKWSVTTNKKIDGNLPAASDKVDGSFALADNSANEGGVDNRIQITSESSTKYAEIYATVTLDLTNTTVNVPKNNLNEATSGTITGFDKNGTKTKDLKGEVKVTGYRKPFWGWKSTTEALADPTAITSAQVRALGKSGTSTAGLPTSLTVPAGTKQIFFAAKAGAKSSLTVKNITKEPATGVACTKKARLLKVDGANGYTAVDYDVWYINLDAAFTGETKLSLTWA